MHVLVTGGAGYLGCRLVPVLLAAGWRVRVLDRGCHGFEGLPSHPALELIRGDIRRLQEVDGLYEGVEAIVHLAGLANDPSCDLAPELAWDVNVESALELARGAVRAGVRRFLLASTLAVYGPGPLATADEASPAEPATTFARTRLEAERGILAMASADFHPVAVRAATLFGPSPRMRFDLAINQMVATAVRAGRIEVRGGGRQWRAFLHVDDAADAFFRLLGLPEGELPAEVLNLGQDNFNFRIADLAARVAEAVPGTSVDFAIDNEDQRSYRVNFDKAARLGLVYRRELGPSIESLAAFVRAMDDDPMSEPYFNAARVKRLLHTPVAEGGDPVAARFIPLSRPNLGEEEERAVVETLRSGWLTSGHHLSAFESAFARTVGARHAIAVTSCTAAIHLCLARLGVGPGDEVITPPLTWVSTGNTILRLGARVVFADVEPETLNLDPAAVEAAITERTRAIIPVHLAGHPCELGPLRALARRRGIALIEDAAHALGASWAGERIGAGPDPACFSFYSIKNITTMEGGMITTPDDEAAARLRRMATNGLEDTAWDRYGRSAITRPLEVLEPGFKYLMGNVAAAMGVEQLKRFESFHRSRQRLARLYSELLGDVEEIILPSVRPGAAHGWHLYVIRLRLERLTLGRDEVAHALRQENIGTGIHFYGLHLHQYYREVLGCRADDLPVATQASREILSLPLHPGLSDRNVHDVAAALKKVLFHARRRG